MTNDDVVSRSRASSEFDVDVPGSVSSRASSIYHSIVTEGLDPMASHMNSTSKPGLSVTLPWWMMTSVFPA